MTHARISVAGSLVVAAGLSVARADILNVPSEPYPTIQAAIQAALDGDEVVVASGTYHELIDFLGKAIVVRSSDGPKATTIDALGLGGSAVTCIGCSGTLQGFTVAGGTGTLDPFFNQVAGGGIYMVGGSLQVTDLVLMQNQATLGGGAFTRYANAVFTGCAFIGNGFNGLVGYPSVTVVDCEFIDNSGGAVFTWVGTVTGCLFEGNSGGYDGVLGIGSGCVANCRFVGNATGGNRGIVTVISIGQFPPGDPQIVDCVFANNQAGVFGGAIVVGTHVAFNLSPVVDGCVFAHNTAELYGGGIVIADDQGSNITATVMNSKFCENEPDDIWGPWMNGGGNEFVVGQCCPADLNGDDVVGIGDFLLVLAQWGPCPPLCLADIDGDQVVGILDFLAVLAAWGPCF